MACVHTCRTKRTEVVFHLQYWYSTYSVLFGTICDIFCNWTILVYSTTLFTLYLHILSNGTQVKVSKNFLISGVFYLDHLTIVCCFEKLGKVWKLTDNSTAERARIFTDTLQQNEQVPFLITLAAEDESWFLFKNLKRKKVCVFPGVSSKGYRKMCTVRNVVCLVRHKRNHPLGNIFMVLFWTVM